MFKLTLSTIRARKARFIFSAVAVALGVAFMAGTFVLTDTIGQAYDRIADNAYQGTDALVRSARSVDSENDGEVRGTIDQTVLDTVRATPGVAAAEPQIEGIAQVVGHDGRLLDDSANRSAPVAYAWQHDPHMNPMELVSGHEPSAADEVVVDRATARAAGLAEGSPVQVITKAGSDRYAVSGIATYGGADDAGGAPVVAFTPATASRVLGEPGRYDAVQVRAADGMSQTELVERVATALGDDGTETLTGAAAAAEAKADSRTAIGFMSTFLLTFAIVSLLVGSFVISNTFSITVAQRTKESALLRAIGASRRQVTRSVVIESFLTGLVASAIGVIAGIGTAVALEALLRGFGIDLPAGDLVISARTVVIGIAVGTVATVVAAYLPARRAAKVPPIAAMRDVAVDDSGRSAKRTVIGAVVTTVGIVLIAMGLAGGGVAAVGLGAVVVFLGVAVLGPVMARWFSRSIGAPLPVLRGMTGTLARENATRNPKRTSATASALMIGVALVTFITVFAASARSSVGQSVDDAMTADWIVATAWGQGGLDPAVATTIDGLDQTGPVASIRYAPAVVGGSPATLSALTTSTIEDVVDLQVVSGSIATLGADGLAVQREVAEQHGWTVGDRVEVTFPETGPQPFAVAVVYDTTEPMGEYAVSTGVFDANVADVVDHYVVIGTADGVPSAEARTAIEGVLADYPTATLQTRAEFKDALAGQIDQMLAMIYTLLALAVLIALFGIANTLGLSIHERIRELGLLRAVGMGRSQVRSAIRWESVIIALLGTTLGLVIGLGFGWALVRAMSSQGFTVLAVPTGQLAVVVLLGAVAGVVAAVLPARRAARVDMLAALREA